jgi:hypothetical protein
MTPETKGPAAAATGRGSINKGKFIMHAYHERRNRRPGSAVASAKPMVADSAPGASHAASWLVRRFGVKPLLAETLAGLAGLGEVRHGR